MALIAFGGIHPTLDRTGEYKVAAAAESGLIFAEETENPGFLIKATDACGYVLEHDVVDDPLVLSDFLLGIKATFATKKGGLADFIRLHPGAMLEIDKFTSGAEATGAIDADTVVGTDLGVVNGLFRVAQAAVEDPQPIPADVVVAVLTENKIATDGTIVVRILEVA